MFLVVISSYYSSESENHLEYPSYGAILDHHPTGSVVYIKGSIIKIYPEGYDILTPYHNKIITLHISGQLAGDLGDEVSLLGVLEPSSSPLSLNVGNVKKIHVISHEKNDFLLITSFLALLFLIIFFFYYWKFNFKKMIFMRR